MCHSCHGAGTTYSVETLVKGCYASWAEHRGCWEFPSHYLKLTNCSLLKCSSSIFRYGVTEMAPLLHGYSVLWSLATPRPVFSRALSFSPPTTHEADPRHSPSISLGCRVPPRTMTTNYMTRSTSYPSQCPELMRNHHFHSLVKSFIINVKYVFTVQSP